MKKEEYIQRYGQAGYTKMGQQNCDRHTQHREEDNARSKRWREANPDAVKEWRTEHREKAKAYCKQWHAQHREEANSISQAWYAANQDKAKENSQEANRKGGKYYAHKQNYMKTGLQGERNIIRTKHQKQYYAIKQATSNSVFHHEWIFGTARYRGVALVDKGAHENGIIKVIKVLEGKITLFTEKEIREQK